MYNVRGVECFGCTCKRDCQLQIQIHIVYCVCGARRCSRKLDETAKYTNGTESSSVQHVLKIVQCIRGKENNIKNTESFLARFLSKQWGIHNYYGLWFPRSVYSQLEEKSFSLFQSFVRSCRSWNMSYFLSVQRISTVGILQRRPVKLSTCIWFLAASFKPP